MKIPTVFGTLSAIAVALAACQSPAERAAVEKANSGAADFALLLPNTPQRVSELHRTPPETFMRKVSGNTVQYVYADPVFCNCLFAGDQKAYAAYEQFLLARNQGRWEWGPWGVGVGWP